MSNKVSLVLGAGPGIGVAVARRLGSAGYDVALVARTESTLEKLGQQLQAEGITAGWSAVDLTDEEQLTASIQRFGQHSGHIDHLHFNPSAYRAKSPTQLTAGELLSDVNLGVASLLTTVRAAQPFLSLGARITATGGATADRPWRSAASLGVQKAALRNLVTALDAELKIDGVRAMSLTVAGTVEEGTAFAPDRIADAIYTAATTPDDEWRSEVRFTG